MTTRSRRFRLRDVLLAVGGVCVALAVAACGSSEGKAGASTSNVGKVAETSSSPECGGAGHKAATGAPLKFGAIVTKMPGVDFSEESKGVEAYFDCVNAHGGVSGRPLQLVVAYEQSNPQEVAADATKLLETDHVVGMVGSMSLIDCSVNAKTYEKAGIYAVGAGVDQACFQQPNFASVSAGPLVAQQMSAQYVLHHFGAKSGFVSVETQCPGCGVYNDGAVAVAKKAGAKGAKGILEPVPVSNPAGLTLQLANEVGEGGTVDVGFTGPELATILNAAAQQGLQERVHWACVSLCTSSSLAKSLNPAWDGKIFSSVEFPLPTANEPETSLARAVMTKYGGEPLNGTNEMGYIAAKIVAETIKTLPASELTRAGINKAIKGITDYKTSLLCKPWYYGTGKSHVPVNTMRIFTLKSGQFVEAAGCTTAEATTPELKESLEEAKKLGIS